MSENQEIKLRVVSLIACHERKLILQNQIRYNLYYAYYCNHHDY